MQLDFPAILTLVNRHLSTADVITEDHRDRTKIQETLVRVERRFQLPTLFAPTVAKKMGSPSLVL